MLKKFAPMSVLLMITFACDPAPPGEDGGPEKGRFDDYGEPIEAELDTWTAVSIPDSKCGNGSEAGIMINPTEASGKVLFYLEGGGACWDAFTCDQGIAAFVRSGISEADYAQFAAGLGASGIFNRQDAQNPFREHSFVYVPYCTGDVHAGTREDNGYGVEHVGYTNIGHYLQRVVPSFPGATEVIVAGTSAGGFGAMVNYPRIREAFIDLPTHLYVDSAPPLGEPVWTAAQVELQNTAWGIEAANPEFCTDDDGGNACTDLKDRFLKMVETYPDARMAFTTSTADETLRFFYGLGNFPPQSVAPNIYADGVSAFVETINAFPNIHAFVVTGTKHTFVYDNPFGSLQTGGVELRQWLELFTPRGRAVHRRALEARARPDGRIASFDGGGVERVAKDCGVVDRTKPLAVTVGRVADGDREHREVEVVSRGGCGDVDTIDIEDSLVARVHQSDVLHIEGDRAA